MRKKHQKGFASVIILLLVIAGVGILIIAKGTIFQNILEKDKARLSNSTGLRIEGDKIYNGSEELFYNVSNVSEVRYGPEGNSIHFKLIDKEKSGSQVECANLEPVQDQYNRPGYNTVGPWDYTLIGDSYPIRLCNTGYVPNSQCFSYATIKDQTVTVFIDADNTLYQIPLDNNLSSKLLEKYKDPNGNYQYVQEIGNREGKDGLTYIFPWRDSYIVANKIVLAFGKMIVGFDLEKRKALGAFSILDQPYKGKIATNYF